MEFALVAPMLVLLLVGMVEAGVQFGTGLLLDSAARDASRFGVTGAATPAGMANPPSDRTAAIRRIVLDRGVGLLRDDRLSMTITSFAGFAEIGQAGAGSDGPGGRGAVVLYEVRYTQPVLTPLASLAFGVGAFIHVATAVVRNEPFPAQ